MDYLIKSINQLNDVWKLTKDTFNLKEPYHLHLDNYDLTTVYGVYQDLLVGTISCTLDGERGLSTDILFPEETNEFRKYRLGSAWRFITKCKDIKPSILLLDQVFHWIEDNLIEYLLIEVNPRHERFYHKVFGFYKLIGPIQNKTIYNKPESLMYLDVKNNLEVWKKNRMRLPFITSKCTLENDMRKKKNLPLLGIK